MTFDEIKQPGGQPAIDAGCTCPRIDNGYGRGYMQMPGVFVYRKDCPLHGTVAASNSVDLSPEATG